MRMLLCSGALPMRAWPPVGHEGQPYRYLYVMSLVGALLVVTINRPHFRPYTIGAAFSTILDLGCQAQFVQPIDIAGGPGAAEVWLSTERNEAYQLGRIT